MDSTDQVHLNRIQPAIDVLDFTTPLVFVNNRCSTSDETSSPIKSLNQSHLQSPFEERDYSFGKAVNLDHPIRLMIQTQSCCIWIDKDIVLNDELLVYAGKLREYAHRISAIRDELHFVCRRNFVGRLSVICDVLDDYNFPLHSALLCGQLSETGLHVAITFDSDEAARVLVERGGPALVMKPYTNALYRDTTALHLAIYKRNSALVDLVLRSLSSEQRYQMLHTQAGSGVLRAVLRRSGLPLTKAALIGDTEIVDLLVDWGAEVDATCAHTGNNILHSVTLNGKVRQEDACAMYRHLMQSNSIAKWWARKQRLEKISCDEIAMLKLHLLKAENNFGYTPLILSTRLGVCELTASMLQTVGVYKFPQWSSGGVTYSLYDMTEIDSTNTERNKPCVLEYFVYSDDENTLKAGACEPLATLMARKWQMYRWFFFSWTVYHALLMLLYTAVIISRPSANEKQPTAEQFTVVGEIIVFTSAVCYLISGTYNLTTSLYYYLKQYRKVAIHEKWYSIPFWVNVHVDTFSIQLLLHSLAVITAYIHHLHGRDVEAGVYTAIGAFFGWAFLLYFARSMKHIGLFTVMLHRILTGDLVRFLFVFVAIMAGFSCALLVLFREADHPVPEMVQTLTACAMSLFGVMIGTADIEDLFDRAAWPIVVRVLFVAFVILVNIQLLNLLIAAMNNTYNAVDQQKDMMWRKIRTRAVMMLESRIPRCMRPNSQFLTKVVKKHGAAVDIPDQTISFLEVFESE